MYLYLSKKANHYLMDYIKYQRTIIENWREITKTNIWELVDEENFVRLCQKLTELDKEKVIQPIDLIKLLYDFAFFDSINALFMH